jgi:hypothetical protein
MANTMMMVPREKIMAKPNFCCGETCSLRRRSKGRITMKMSATTSALAANLIETSALHESSGSLHPALQISMSRLGNVEPYVYLLELQYLDSGRQVKKLEAIEAR